MQLLQDKLIVQVQVNSGRDILVTDDGNQKVCVTVKIGGSKDHTQYVERTTHPFWNSLLELKLYPDEPPLSIQFFCTEQGGIQSKQLGYGQIPLTKLFLADGTPRIFDPHTQIGETVPLVLESSAGNMPAGELIVHFGLDPCHRSNRGEWELVWRKLYANLRTYRFNGDPRFGSGMNPGLAGHNPGLAAGLDLNGVPPNYPSYHHQHHHHHFPHLHHHSHSNPFSRHHLRNWFNRDHSMHRHAHTYYGADFMHGPSGPGYMPGGGGPRSGTGPYYGTNGNGPHGGGHPSYGGYGGHYPGQDSPPYSGEFPGPSQYHRHMPGGGHYGQAPYPPPAPPSAHRSNSYGGGSSHSGHYSQGYGAPPSPPPVPPPPPMHHDPMGAGGPSFAPHGPGPDRFAAHSPPHPYCK